jgi:hypothetical protein
MTGYPVDSAASAAYESSRYRLTSTLEIEHRSLDKTSQFWILDSGVLVTVL